jgi:hypothetical protein
MQSSWNAPECKGLRWFVVGENSIPTTSPIPQLRCGKKPHLPRKMTAKDGLACTTAAGARRSVDRASGGNDAGIVHFLKPR